MATKSKLLACGMLLLLVVAFYAWSKRSINVEIAGVSFKFPAQVVVSSGEAVEGLDRNSGAFVVLPNGPSHGNWGLLLQSSKDRGGDGMPPGLKENLGKGDQHFSKTPFGWFACDGNCGREAWFFHRVPNKADSTYSVGTVVCFDTDICNLFLSYKEVDVQVSVERQKVSEASEVMRQVPGLLGQYDVASKDAMKRK